MSAHKERTVANVIAAAQAWVESIHDHPGEWANVEDADLIRAVRAHIPGVECIWLGNPAYEGWLDSTAPDCEAL